MNILRVAVCCLGLLVLAVSQAPADVVTPVAVDPSSEFADADNMINGSGLDGIGNVQDQRHDNDEDNMWQTFSNPSVGETATFDLGANYDLSSALIWQYNGFIDLYGLGTPQRQVNEFELAVSSGVSEGGFTSIGTFNLAEALDQSAPGFNEPAQGFALTGADNVRRVQLTINSTYLPDMADGFAGLSEVRFEGTIVPEPATVGLLGLAMLTLLGFAHRRRKA